MVMRDGIVDEQQRRRGEPEQGGRGRHDRRQSEPGIVPMVMGADGNRGHRRQGSGILAQAIGIIGRCCPAQQRDGEPRKEQDDGAGIDPARQAGKCHEAAEQVEQPDAGTAVQPLFLAIARQEPQHMAAGADIKRIARDDDRKAGDGGAPETAAAQEGGRHHDGQELRQHGASQRRAGPSVAVPRAQQQPEAEKADRDGINMPVTGKGP